MFLGFAEKTTPIYSGFPRALLWGINPSALGPQSPFDMENFPGKISPSPSGAGISPVCGSGQWPIYSLEQVTAFSFLSICTVISILCITLHRGSFCEKQAS